MPEKKQDAYSLLCQSLDLMGSAMDLGSNFMRVAADEWEHWQQAWDAPEGPGEEAETSPAPQPQQREGPSAIERAREAVNRNLQKQPFAASGCPARRERVAKPETPAAAASTSETEAPPASANEAAPASAMEVLPQKAALEPKPEKAPRPSLPQTDHLDERAQRLLARFVDPDPDFFERSPFEDWDAFQAPKKSSRK